jgi:hypothetical protein
MGNQEAKASKPATSMIAYPKGTTAEKVVQNQTISNVLKNCTHGRDNP